MLGKKHRKLPTVVFIGDSITSEWKEIDPLFFEKNHYINKGVGGQATPQMLARFATDVVSYSPEAVVIAGGVNDIFQLGDRYEPNDTFLNMSKMICLGQEAGIECILLSVMPVADRAWGEDTGYVPEQIIEFNIGLQTLARQSRCVYVDCHSALSNPSTGHILPQFTTDGVHLTSEAYEVIRSRVERAIHRTILSL